jgi:hypothetical protein
MRTPWGESQQITTIAKGILSLSTAGHGGIKLYKARNQQVPDYLRAGSELREAGWYEEDCDWCLPAIIFEKEWRAYADRDSSWSSGDKQLKSAWETFINWHPESWERYTGKTLVVGESLVRDQELFRLKQANNYVALASWGDWHNQVPEGMVGVFAGRGGRQADGSYPPDTKYFLVPIEDYHRQARVGQASWFVVDPKRHAECEPIA